MAHFAEGKVCAGKLPNKGEEQLKFEFARLGGDGNATAAIDELGFDSRLAEAPTLNTGCVGASVRHWRVLRDQYNRNAQAVKKYTSHYARQQFLMSLIIHSRFELEIMPKYIHCDGHYALPEFIHEESETFVYRDRSVVLPAFYCHGGLVMKYAYPHETQTADTELPKTRDQRATTNGESHGQAVSDGGNTSATAPNLKRKTIMNIHHAVGRLSDVTGASWDGMRYLRSNWTTIGKVGRMFPKLHYVCFGQKEFVEVAPEPEPENLPAEQEKRSSELLPVKVQDAVRPSTNRPTFFGSVQKLGGVGLEIGPLHAPICRRDTHNIRYVDAFTTEELKAHYASDPNVPVDNIVDVDYVWRGEPYADLIPERFDYVVSSHNIEHVPCLVDFLNNLASCLNPGGKLFFAIPDKRYCFDHFKPESSIAEVLDAHFTKRQKPAPWHIVRHELLRTHNSPIDHWSGEHGRPAYMIDGNFFVQGDIPPDSMAGIYSPQKHELSEPLLERLKGHYSCSEYHDTHVWIMTPFSFARIVDFLTAHRLVSLELSELYPTEPNSHEFYAVLSKS